MGIEYDKFRTVNRYWLRKSNPVYESYIGSGSYFSDYDYYPVNADEVCHLYVKEYVNQGARIPWSAPAALRMHMINKTSEAAVINFRIGASKTLILKPTENIDPSIEEISNRIHPEIFWKMSNQGKLIKFLGDMNHLIITLNIQIPNSETLLMQL